MDPYCEQRLRDEVIYLHSLWHQGPPRSNPNTITINSNPPTYLQPSNTTQFKKENKSRTGRKGRKSKNRPPKSDSSPPPPASDIEWPCKPSAQSEAQPQLETTLSWPNYKPQSTPSTQLPSAENQARFAANQVQQNALKATQKFFACNVDTDGDDSADEEDEEDDRCDEFEFFLKVFTEDGELRGYYEKNYEKGEFSCLVCGGIGKTGKRFKDCVALVQHSITVAKTKKRRAHRAFGKAICKVLGWSIDRVPTVVLFRDDPPNHSIASSGQSQNALMVADVTKNVEDVDKESLNTAERDVKDVANCVEPFKEDGVGSTGNLVEDNVVLGDLKSNSEGIANEILGGDDNEAK